MVSDSKSSFRLRQITYLAVLAVMSVTTFFPITITFPENVQITSSAQGTQAFPPQEANAPFGSAYGQSLESLGNYSSDQLLISQMQTVNSTQTANVTQELPLKFQLLNMTGVLIEHSAVFMMNLSKYEGLQIDSLELKVFIVSVKIPGPVQLSWFIVPSLTRGGAGDIISVSEPGIYAWKANVGLRLGRNQQLVMQLTPGNQIEKLFGQVTSGPPAVSLIALSVKSNRPPEMEVTFLRTYDPPGTEAFGIWMAYGIVTIVTLRKNKWAELLYNLVFIGSALSLLMPIAIFRFGMLLGVILAAISAIFFLLLLLWQLPAHRINR